jgi:hypothetical protein
MPAIIYQKTPGGLFATGERTVSTFPSGLIRVDQTFICPTSDAATHRAALAVGSDMPGGSAPAIDGLKIFPEPQEKKRDNGFTEFIVSAYGRMNNNGSLTISKKIRFFAGKKYISDVVTLITSRKNSDSISIPEFDANISFLSGQNGVFVFTNKTISFQGYNTDTTLGLTYTVSEPKAFIVVIPDTTSSVGTQGPMKYITVPQSKLSMVSYNETNFGDFNEVTITYDSGDLIIRIKDSTIQGDYSTDRVVTVS